MCTLAWKRDQLTGLEVYFNRDELKTRPIARPLRVLKEDGVRFLSPQDPRGGGTWMLANEYGAPRPVFQDEGHARFSASLG